MTIREALAQSLNIPAVKVLAAVGPGKLAGRFRRVGVEPGFPRQEPADAGHGARRRRLDAARHRDALHGPRRAAATSSRSCTGAPTRRKPHWHCFTGNNPRAKRLLSPLAAWYVTDILKDAPPPLNAKAGRFAYKTGTSYGYRDAWAVGYDGKYMIAVWVGRPDAASTPGPRRPPRRRTHFVRCFRTPRRSAHPASGRASRRPARHRLRVAAAAEALPRGRRRDGAGTVPRAARAHFIST